MNQLAYETSFHPGPFQASAAFDAAYPPPPAPARQGFHPQQPQGYDQAFAYPGQQRQHQYHDGVNQLQARPASTGAGMMQAPLCRLVHFIIVSFDRSTM